MTLSKTQITSFPTLQRIKTKYGISVVIKRMSILLRKFHGKNFYHLVSPDSQPPKFTVSYLSSINDLPTKYEVAQEILLHCKEKAEALDLETADLVSDHAIYSKALEISL